MFKLRVRSKVLLCFLEKLDLLLSLFFFGSSKTAKNAFKDKVKEIQAEMDESSSETAESGFASPADEQPSPR